MVEKNLYKAFSFMSLSSLCGAGIAICIKSLSFEVSITVIFFLTRLFLLVGAAPALYRNRLTLLSVQYVKPMLVMSLFYVAGMYCYFYALTVAPLALSSLLMNSSPLYVPAIAFFVLKDRSIQSKTLWLTMLISFAGMSLILMPAGRQHDSLTGLLLAWIAGVLLATSQVYTKLAGEQETPEQITFFQSMVSIIVTFPPALYVIITHNDDSLIHLFTLKNAIFLISAGIFSWTYQLYRATAMQYAPVSLVMPMGYLGVVFVGIADAMLWEVFPSWLNIAGMLLVVMGVILLLQLNSSNTHSEFKKH